jgi:hypothetical protein
MKKLLLFILVLSSVSACSWREPAEGTVEVKTIYGEATGVIKPSDGGVWEHYGGWHWMDAYHTVNVKAKTEEYVVSASSKDNAGLKIPISVTFYIPSEGQNGTKNVIGYVKKFGLTSEIREKERTLLIQKRVEDITRKNTSEFNAYELLISQQGIQKAALTDLKQIFKTQIFAELESVVVGKPDFIDDSIETAGSRVVAAKKKEEEEEALKKASETRIQRLEIEAKTFENPKMYALELKKLEIEEAREWAKHSGTLIINKGSGSAAVPMVQVK